MRTQGEYVRLQAKERGSEDTNSADTLTWDFQPPESEKINVCCLSHPACGTLLWPPWQTNSVPGNAHSPLPGTPLPEETVCAAPAEAAPSLTAPWAHDLDPSLQARDLQLHRLPALPLTHPALSHLLRFLTRSPHLECYISEAYSSFKVWLQYHLFQKVLTPSGFGLISSLWKYVFLPPL